MVETWLLFIIELDLVMPTACQSSYFCVCVCVCSFYFNIYTFKVLSLCKFSINLVSCDELTLTMYIYIYQANFYFILFAFHFTSENHKIQHCIKNWVQWDNDQKHWGGVFVQFSYQGKIHMKLVLTCVVQFFINQPCQKLYKQVLGSF